MARRCDPCNQAFEDDVTTCPFCRGETEFDERPIALLAAAGYEIHRSRRAREVGSTQGGPRSPERSQRPVGPSRRPVRTSISDDAVEELRRAYDRSAPSKPLVSVPATSAPSATDSDLERLDNLIDELGIDSASGQSRPEGPVDTAAAPRTERWPSAPSGASVMEDLRVERERAEREMERARNRQRIADAAGSVLRPGAATWRVVHYLLVIVGVLLFVAFLLPPLASAAFAALSALLPSVLLIVIGCWLVYRIFKG